MPIPLSRRDWLRLAFATASAGWLPARAATTPPRLSQDPFALGVASGTPTADGVVLWTRALGLPPGSAAAVRWEVADDPAFRRIVQRGQSEARTELAHTVHVELRGLQPERWYHYRFMLGDAVSATGRTRTAPAPGALPARLRLAAASCQRWEHGYYAAWRDCAAEAPDLVLFLGDYIYEYATPRTPAEPLARVHTLRHARTLTDYRDRYALHKGDPDLQAAHAASPWLVTWDDHEVANDYAGDHVAADPAGFDARRAAAYQAFYEHMPLPASALVRGLAGLGAADAVRVHTRPAFGRLARFHMLDTRQFRSLQACRDFSRSSASAVRPDDCPELADPRRSLLGAAQEAWLADGLAADARAGGARWSFIAQQTLFSPRHYGAPGHGPVPSDPWDGYPAARGRLLQALAAMPPRNTVFLGGDLHQNFVADVPARADDLASPAIASEFCGTSISSWSGVSAEKSASLLRHNPHLRLADGTRRGYLLAELTPAALQVALRVVADPFAPASTVSTLARFVVEDGRAGVQRAG